MSVSEIAKMAGVSVATVSRVLNNHPRVRPETVQQVRKVLQDLGYVRPTIRRGPRLGRRGGTRLSSIAVIGLGDKTHARFRFSVFAAALAGIVRAARELELNVLVDDVANVSELCPAVRNGDVDGALVFVPPRSTPTPSGWKRSASACPSSHDGQPHQHHQRRSRRLGQHGHRQPRLPVSLGQGLPASWRFEQRPTWDFNQTRAFGFLHAARQAGVCRRAMSSRAIRSMPSRSARGVVRCETKEQLVERLATASPRPSGVFVCRDTDAIRFQPLLQAKGVSINSDGGAADIMLISCDNDEVRLSMLSPRPISIDLCPEEIGRRGMIRLAGRIRKPQEPSFRTLIVPRLPAGPGLEQQFPNIAAR